MLARVPLSRVLSHNFAHVPATQHMLIFYAIGSCPCFAEEFLDNITTVYRKINSTQKR